MLKSNVEKVNNEDKKGNLGLTDDEAVINNGKEGLRFLDQMQVSLLF